MPSASSLSVLPFGFYAMWATVRDAGPFGGGPTAGRGAVHPIFPDQHLGTAVAAVSSDRRTSTVAGGDGPQRGKAGPGNDGDENRFMALGHISQKSHLVA